MCILISKKEGEIMRNAYTLMENNVNLLAQNTRLDIIGELDAIIQYEAHIASSTDPTYRATLQDIVNEEKVHVGQLFGLLFMLDPASKEFFEKGLNEFTKQSTMNYKN